MYKIECNTLMLNFRKTAILLFVTILFRDHSKFIKYVLLMSEIYF